MKSTPIQNKFESKGRGMFARRTQVILSLTLLFGASAYAQHGSHGGPSAPTVPPSSFSTDVTGLPEVTQASEVILKNGESYLLKAAPAKQNIGGQWIRRLAYNGSVPGPIFRVKQGATVYISLQNDTEIETTLHPHGVRVDAAFDGVPGISQNPIKPGQSYDYTLHFPDAGIYWYHPHIREDYTQEAGLYGVFIVEPENPAAYNPVHREVPLVLDDMLVDPTKGFQKNVVTHTLMGRFGNVNMVNGLVMPSFSAQKDEVVRFFILNTSNTRVFAFAIPGLQLKLVGGDNGFYEKEEWKDKVILGPGERSIVEVKFSKTGTLPLVNAKPKGSQKIAQIQVASSAAAPLSQNFAILRAETPATTELVELRSQLKKAVEKSLKLTLTMDHSLMPMDMGGMNHGSMAGMDHGSMPGMNHGSAPVSDGIEWDDEMPDMNAKSTNQNVKWIFRDQQTNLENMAIQWAFKSGSLTKIRIFNDPTSMHPMQHPVHFHGQRFLVAAVNGKEPTNLVWKDTVLVPSGATYDILLEASNIGDWMAHCHISEHMEASMMFGFKVQE